MHVLTIALSQACKSKHGQSINHQQSIFSQRHTAGPDRVLSTCLPVSLSVKSVSRSILVGQSPQYHRCTRRPAAWWENPIPPRPDHSKSHLYAIRVALSAEAALTKAPSYWLRHNVVKPPDVFGWPANNSLVCLEPKSICPVATGSLSCPNLRQFTRSAVEHP